MSLLANTLHKYRLIEMSNTYGRRDRSLARNANSKYNRTGDIIIFLGALVSFILSLTLRAEASLRRHQGACLTSLMVTHVDLYKAHFLADSLNLPHVHLTILPRNVSATFLLVVHSI